MLRFAFIMDPIEGIDIFHDTTFAMMREVRRRGHQMFYGLVRDLSVREGRPWLSALPLAIQDIQGKHYEFGPRESMCLDGLDAVFMRRDPPFDLDYVFATYVLDLADPRRCLVFNRPQALRDCNEKMYILRFPEVIPPTAVTKSRGEIQEAIAAWGGAAVLKPLDGFAGRGVFLARAGDPNLGVILETVTQRGSAFVMVQKYLPEITQGDKRIIVIDGQAIGAIARVPQPGEHRGNMAAGGKPAAAPLTARDQAIVRHLGPRLRADGILFAGIDVIGDYLTEINITSPTGFQEVDRLCGTACGRVFMDAVETALGGREQ